MLRLPHPWYNDDDSDDVDKFVANNLKLDPYGQIGFYFQPPLVWDRALELPADCWTRVGLERLPVQDEEQTFDPEAVEAVNLLREFVNCLPVPQNCANATAFIEDTALGLAAPSEERVREALAEQETRVEAIRCLTGHRQKIHDEVAAVRAYIVQTLELIIERDGLKPTEASPLVTPGSAQETWLCDGGVDAMTRDKFISEVKQLEDVPEEQKDWHPNTDHQVLNLVHPSLFCCVLGTTRCLTTRPAESEMSSTKLFMTGTQEVLQGRRYGPRYQWTPTEFRVSSSGQTQILSYISNLHPEDFAPMYDSIARIFDSFVPLFDRVLNSLAGPTPEARFEVPDMFRRPAEELPERPVVPSEAKLHHVSDTFTIRGRMVQVIVKIAEICLTPEKPKYEGGSWHIEGTETEQIRATGLYYFGCENITESRLSFRVQVNQPDYEQSDHAGICAMYGLQSQERLVQLIGFATATNGRCVVFPNSLEHKVEPFELLDPTNPGTRKILAFFLVNPTKTILSTAVIGAQQQSWIDRHEAPVLEKLKLPEAMESKVRDLVGSGMTMEQAQKHRLWLMKARSGYRNEDLYFNLCEH